MTIILIILKSFKILSFLKACYSVSVYPDILKLDIVTHA